MATLTVQVVSALGTSTKTLTFSSADATRIFTAWKAWTKQPSGTQDQMVTDFAAFLQTELGRLVLRNEQVTPIAPVMT